VKLVLSLEQNHYIAFIFAGLILACHYRLRALAAVPGAISAGGPFPAFPQPGTLQPAGRSAVEKALPPRPSLQK
jgi:hypothetical protein